MSMSMSYRFHVRHINTPLLGAIAGADDAAKEDWRQDFAGGTDSSIWIDDLALDWLATELELDHEALAWDAQRYVQGQYRPKADGMSGGRLGELGELLTYLAERGAGRDIVRVLGADTGRKVMLEGHTYCYPDFVIRKGPTNLALEVKSTEALNHQAMVSKLEQHRKNPRCHMNLAPCHGAEAGREAALAQLGHTTPQPAHGLRLRDGTSVPYPVNHGVAMSVMPVDGRVRRHWNEQAFKTPPACRKQGRHCVSCVGPAEVLMTRMPNAPGHLPLLGQGDRDGTPWFQAYERWTQALMCHDALAIEHATEALLGPLHDWTLSLDAAQQALAFTFWGMHLRLAVRERGLNAQAYEALLARWPDQQPEPPREALDDAPRGRHAELRGEMLTTEAFLSRLADILEYEVPPPMLFSLSEGQATDHTPTATWTVRALPHRLDVFMMSAQWWRQKRVETEFEAGQLVRNVLRFLSPVLGDFGLSWNNDVAELDVRSQWARVGEQEVMLGWLWLANIRYFSRPWWWFHRGVQPTCSARVTPDGRVQLTLIRHVPA